MLRELCTTDMIKAGESTGEWQKKFFESLMNIVKRILHNISWDLAPWFVRYRLMLKPCPGTGPFGNLTTFSGDRTAWDWLFDKQLVDDDGDILLLTNGLLQEKLTLRAEAEEKPVDLPWFSSWGLVWSSSRSQNSQSRLCVLFLSLLESLDLWFCVLLWGRQRWRRVWSLQNCDSGLWSLKDSWPKVVTTIC